MRGHDIPVEDIEELTAIAKENGISYFQLAIKKSMPSLFGDKFEYSKETADIIKSGLDKANIGISVLGSYINPVARDKDELKAQLDFYKENAKFAKHLNAGCIGSETGNYESQEYTHGEENYQYFLKSAEQMITACEENNVIGAFEPVSIFTIDTPKKAKRMIDDLSSKNVGIILDIVNILSVENHKNLNYIIDEAFDLFADRIVALHIKDYIIENGNKIACDIGKGIMEYDYLFKQAKKLGRDVDMLIDETPIDKIPQSIAYLDTIWKNA